MAIKEMLACKMLGFVYCNNEEKSGLINREIGKADR